MAKFTCTRCGYNTELKYNFKKHLTKKNICPPKKSNVMREAILKEYGLTERKCFVNVFTPNVNVSKCSKSVTTQQDDIIDENQNAEDLQYQCNYCHKKFKTRQSKYQHQKKYCKQKSITEQHIYQEKRIEDLTSQVQGLLQMIMESNNQMTNSHNNNNNNITNNNNNTQINNQITNNTQLQINNQINNYGSEDTSYITKEQYKEILQNPFTGLSKLITITHFNDDHPENKNLCIPNKKQPYIEYYDNGWVIGNRYKFVCKLFFIKKEALHQAYLEVEDMLDEKTKEAYRFFREETTLNPKTVESQLKDIQAAIMSGTRKRKEFIEKRCREMAESPDNSPQTIDMDSVNITAVSN
jgi:hypothetical protein